MRLRNFGLNDIVELQEKVRGWAEARFAPGENDIVSVSEVACAEPGCPPFETLVTLFPDGRAAVKFKIYKALADVGEIDIQRLGKPGWTLSDEKPAF
jgi:hypothetical protein